MMKKRQLLAMLGAVILLAACGGRRGISDAELAHKIDSVKKLEVLRQMQLRGIRLEEPNPLQMFYDSLRLQSLPVSYSEEYVKYLPDYTVVPPSIVAYLELEGKDMPKAIALPETLGTRLVLLAADVDDGNYELWLYSLDPDCYVVDKLMLYEPKKVSESHLYLPKQETYFSITSNYEIRVWEYEDDEDPLGQLSTYVVDDSLQFVEKTAMVSP